MTKSFVGVLVTETCDETTHVMTRGGEVVDTIPCYPQCSIKRQEEPVKRFNWENSDSL